MLKLLHQEVKEGSLTIAIPTYGHVSRHVILRYLERCAGIRYRNFGDIPHTERIRVRNKILEELGHAVPLTPEQQAFVQSQPRHGGLFRNDTAYLRYRNHVYAIKGGSIATVITLTPTLIDTLESTSAMPINGTELLPMETVNHTQHGEECIDVEQIRMAIKMDAIPLLPYNFLAHVLELDVDPACDYYLFGSVVVEWLCNRVTDAFELVDHGYGLIRYLRSKFNIRSTVVPLAVARRLTDGLHISDTAARMRIRELLNSPCVDPTVVEEYVPVFSRNRARYFMNEECAVEVVGNIVTFAAAIT